MFCQAQVSAVFHDELQNNRDRRETLWTLAGARLVCHCKLWQDCHGDVITEEHAQMHPDAGPVFTLHHQLQMSWTTWLVSEKSQRLTPGLLQEKLFMTIADCYRQVAAVVGEVSAAGASPWGITVFFLLK